MLWSSELDEYIAEVKVASKALSEMSEEIILELVLAKLKKIDDGYSKEGIASIYRLHKGIFTKKSILKQIAEDNDMCLKCDYDLIEAIALESFDEDLSLIEKTREEYKELEEYYYPQIKIK